MGGGSPREFINCFTIAHPGIGCVTALNVATSGGFGPMTAPLSFVREVQNF